MSETPETDKAEEEFRESWGLTSGQEEMAETARKLERRITRALRAIEAQRQGATESAEITSNEIAATWSSGVAKGLEIAAGFLKANDKAEPPRTNE